MQIELCVSFFVFLQELDGYPVHVLAYGWLVHSLGSLCDSFHTFGHRLGGSAYRICRLGLRADLKVDQKRQMTKLRSLIRESLSVYNDMFFVFLKHVG